MQHLPTICFIIPYFGRWPFWMPYFLASCRHNPSINWLLYTDCGEVENCPANVNIVNISFESYCKKVSQKLHIKFAPIQPYKLCDIKPALGLIHEAELTAFDFWAFGDIDVIYGDLRQYYTVERLQNKDIFASHDRRISGHLCIVRNNDEMNLAFKRVKNWASAFVNPNHLTFDEKAFSKLFLRHKNSALMRMIVTCFDRWLKRAEFTELYCTPNARIRWLDGSSNYPNIWTWNEARLTNDINADKQFLYLHFMIWKKSWLDQASNCKMWPDNSKIKQFMVTKDGFNIT